MFSPTIVQVGLPPLIVAVIGAFSALLLVHFISQAPNHCEIKDDETKSIAMKMQEIAESIEAGAIAFLKLEYTALTVAVCALFILIASAVHWSTGICYLCGAGTSALCGYIGMRVAVYSNVRTAAAAEKGLNAALRVAFNSGSVMGLSVVSGGLGAISALLMIFGDEAIQGRGALAGFGMGASTVSIFARVGGGIFTKAADVGADLVGKVEAGIPEDDPRNPATIADNVGDNVGDIAGMGADLFSSFVGSIIASSLLGSASYGNAGIALPYWISMSGIICCLVGMLTIRTEEGADQNQLLNVLRRAMTLAACLNVGCMAIIIYVLELNWKLFGCLIIGLAAGSLISTASEYFTSFAYGPTIGIARSGLFGPANVVIEGISVGSFSTIAPVSIIAGTIIAVYELAGSVYGIALASTGLLSTLALGLATDAYGPVADNAGGIAEMSGMPEQTRKNTDVLDALGNTTAAVGKGFAVGSAVLTAVSLLTTFYNRVGALPIDAIRNERFIAGILIGSMLPYWFGALTMGAVAKAAGAVVVEVRRQFRETAGLLEGKKGVKADHATCVAMVTRSALYFMVFPALLVVLTPIVVGVGLGPQILAGLLLGAITSGFVFGGLMNAAGGAWDNAKKYNEKQGLKGSNIHKATVVGDTIGDPFKDTSGPSINILIKLMSYISVVLAPVFKNWSDYWWASLIIIGIVIIFVPFWISRVPAGLSDEDRFGMVSAAPAAAPAAEAAPVEEAKIEVKVDA